MLSKSYVKHMTKSVQNLIDPMTGCSNNFIGGNPTIFFYETLLRQIGESPQWQDVAINAASKVLIPN